MEGNVMHDGKGVLRKAALTGASFAGYNIGSGFSTGIEAMQFFAAWGAGVAACSVAVAALISAAVLAAIYVVGSERAFDGEGEVYSFFCGKYLGPVADAYIYASMFFVVLTMMTGAGAAIHQYCGLPQHLGSAVMGAMCIATAMLGLKKLMRVLGYMCFFIIIFVFVCGIWAFFTSDTGPLAGSARAAEYVADGKLLRAMVFGFHNPYMMGVLSAGLFIEAGFAWAAAAGALCSGRREAVLSGFFSSFFYYVTTSVVVALILAAMDYVAGKEVPMLAVVNHYLPALTGFYYLIIVLAIFSTVSGRLFLLASRFDRGSKRRHNAILIGVTLFSVAFGGFLSFSKLSNVIMSIMGSAGILICFSTLLKFYQYLREKPRA